MKTKHLLLLLFLYLIPSLMAQEIKSISGVVLDESGSPIIGANVKALNSNIGAATDVNGIFNLFNVPENAILRVSFLGYQSVELPANSSKVSKITLREDNKLIEEVVVIGYGKVVSKDKLTASISKVSGTILENGIRSNALTSLSGSVTGVRITQTSGQPGTAPAIVIRGGTTLNGTGVPLYIIDGMQKEDMNDINSNDIESIEILKDAAATALYGARASNGVVLVTTKKGSLGKTAINFKTNAGRNYLRKTFNFLNAEDYLYWSRVGARRSMNQSSDKSAIQNLLDGSTPYGTGNILMADGNATTAGVWSPVFLADDNKYLLGQGWKSMTDPVTGKEIIYNEFSAKDGSFQEAWTQDYNLAVSGGNDRGKFYSSLGYYSETGLPLDTYYNRYSLNINGEYKIKPWMTALAMVNVSKSGIKEIVRADKEDEYFGIMLSAPPTMRKYNQGGDLIVGHNYQNGNWSASIDKFYRRDETYKGTFNTGFKLNITDYLYLKLTGMWYMNMRERESFNKAYLSAPGVTDTNRKASANYGRNLNQTYNAILSFDKIFGNHNINTVAGAEFVDKFHYELNAAGQGADSDDFINLQYTTALVSGAETKTTRTMSTYHVQERMMSFFMNTTYDYSGKYLFAFSGRYDGYSKLINNRWGFFPGISAAWNINKEPFMKPYGKIISLWKWRASFGQNGNVNMVSGAYDLQGNYGTTPNYNGNYGFLINKLPYPNLRWEKTTSFDVATEITLYNKLRFTIDYFNKTTSDLLASVPFPTSAGVGNMLTNNGSVRSAGWELEVDYTAFSNENLKWRIGANMTYIRSKILSLPDNGNENNRQDGQQVYNPTTGNIVWVGGYQQGQEYGDIYAWEKQAVVRDNIHLQEFAEYIDRVPAKAVYGPAAYARLTDVEKANAQQLMPGDVAWKDVNGDNIIDAYDQTYQGNSVPKIMGGFHTTLEWKNISFFARFDYAGGYKTYNSRKAWYMGMAQGTFNTIEEVKQTWTEENLNASYPVFQYADQNYKKNYMRNSSMFWENGAYLCAREITWAYNFPKKWINPLHINNLLINITGQNLFYLTASSLYTPEYGGNQNGGYPAPVSAFMGLKVTF